MNKISDAINFLGPPKSGSEFFSWKKSASLGAILIALNLVYSIFINFIFTDEAKNPTNNTYFRVFWIIFISPFIETIVIGFIFLTFRRVFNAAVFSILCGIMTGGIMHYPWGWSTPYQTVSFIAFSYMFYVWQRHAGWRSAILMVSVSHMIANTAPAVEKLVRILLKNGVP